MNKNNKIKKVEGSIKSCKSEKEINKLKTNLKFNQAFLRLEKG